ncbi:MAG: hypothetical protein JSU85_02355 [Candidatus Zixiibacteriota bacterium]|nr:MAG: hypothetical protein JSU85_02355 [candidate division Zixibacteria bacterium]
MAEEEKKVEIVEKTEPENWVDFLQEHPPGSLANVLSAYQVKATSYGVDKYTILKPELQLQCPESTCNAYMFFNSESYEIELDVNEWKFTYIKYICRNCRKYSKTFSIAICLRSEGICEAFKFGELPSFGPPIPPRVLRLIQPDRELFLKGRRCENQGLGVGAFAYYRRVVENQWTRVVDEIIKVGKAIGMNQEYIDILVSARDETQFSKAVKSIKEAIPPMLLINGQNPLTLLHGALSIGVHDLPDEKCLAFATSIRVVLIELSEKLEQALKDEKELKSAVSQLLQVKEEKKNTDKKSIE